MEGMLIFLESTKFFVSVKRKQRDWNYVGRSAMPTSNYTCRLSLRFATLKKTWG